MIGRRVALVSKNSAISSSEVMDAAALPKQATSDFGPIWSIVLSESALQVAFFYLVVLLLAGCASTNPMVQSPPMGQDLPPTLTMTIIVTTPAPASDVSVFTATKLQPTDPSNFGYDIPVGSTVQLALVARNHFPDPNGNAMGGVKQALLAFDSQHPKPYLIAAENSPPDATGEVLDNITIQGENGAGGPGTKPITCILDTGGSIRLCLGHDI
ncbi:MAG TPA: hypothetical protein VL171_15585 [Verrucomicrobiae bacterium]|nr:hypothetical protein [Verrucomicrobiae bacterium]